MSMAGSTSGSPICSVAAEKHVVPIPAGGNVCVIGTAQIILE